MQGEGKESDDGGEASLRSRVREGISGKVHLKRTLKEVFMWMPCRKVVQTVVQINIMSFKGLETGVRLICRRSTSETIVAAPERVRRSVVGNDI